MTMMITIFEMEFHELITLGIITTGMIFLIICVYKFKSKIKRFERNDLEEKLLMAQTAELLRKATVETAANLKEATIQTAIHLKETTTETARILAERAVEKPCEILESINEKLNVILTRLPTEE